MRQPRSERACGGAPVSAADRGLPAKAEMVPILLVNVHIPIRGIHQLRKGHTVLRHLGATEGKALKEDARIHFGLQSPKLMGQLSVAGQTDKLIAGFSEEKGLVIAQAFQGLGEMDQIKVSCFVAEGVIDVFKVVQVEEQQKQLSAFLLHGVELFHQRDAVSQLCQGISSRHELEFLLVFVRLEVIHQQDVRLDHIEHQQKQEQQLFKFGGHIDQQNAVCRDEDKAGGRLCKQQPHVGGFVGLAEKLDKFLLILSILTLEQLFIF